MNFSLTYTINDMKAEEIKKDSIKRIMSIARNPNGYRLENIKEEFNERFDGYASDQCQKRDELIEAQDELIEWLNQECPLVAPPLEPYTNYDLTHNFCDGLRIRLDKIEQLKSEIK